MSIPMWNGSQMTPALTWFTSKAELQRENDSKSGWQCFRVLVVLICSVTGALSAAECQVIKWDMDRSEVKVRAETKTSRQAKKPQTQPRQDEFNYLSLVFIRGILQMTQLQGLNLKHIFMGSWVDVGADCSEKQWDLILPTASLISLLALCQGNGNILSPTLIKFCEHTKTTENYPVVALFCFLNIIVFPLRVVLFHSSELNWLTETPSEC